MVQLRIKVDLKLELSKVEELMSFRKNFDIHPGKYFDIMLFVFNSYVFSFLIDSAHPRSPSIPLFISLHRNNKLAVSVSSRGNLGGQPKTALCFLNNDET